MADFRQILFRVKLLFSRVRPCANQSSETPYIDRLSATDRHAFSCRKAQTVRARSFQKSIVASNAFASIAQLSHLCPLYLRRNFYVNIRYLSALSSFYQNRPAFALSASNIIYSFVIFDLLSHFAKKLRSDMDRCCRQQLCTAATSDA